MVVQISAKSGARGTKRVKVWLHWNLRQKLCGCLFKRNKI